MNLPPRSKLRYFLCGNPVLTVGEVRQIVREELLAREVFMGCDIHGWVETKVGGKWIAIKELAGQGHKRNYLRFAAMAGVRGDGPEPRGIPADVSETTRWGIDQDGPDGHSHSWLSLHDAAAIYRSVLYPGEVRTDLEKNRTMQTYFNVSAEDSPPENFRLVFWFDN